MGKNAELVPYVHVVEPGQEAWCAAVLLLLLTVLSFTPNGNKVLKLIGSNLGGNVHW